nr:retrotransposon protein, putative, Ty1-copia subclass [Tanacetum cinerariifolium]
MSKTLVELHAMLKLYEKGIPKKAETPAVLAIREGKIQKDRKKLQGAKGKANGKNKLAYAPKMKISPPPNRDNLVKDYICHHCKEVDHWMRNCPSYHAELKKRKNASEASTSDIFTIELYAFSNNNWVYDMGCGTHISNTSQGLRGSRKLKHGALSMYIGNGMCASVEAIRKFDFILPSGLIIVLRKCHFTPTVTRGVVSVSHLVKAVIFIHLRIMHCRLGHINKKRMDMLNLDGLLQPTHDESHKKCKSCIFGKMASKPFPHQVERAKDLLGLIHTDVCGPFRTVSREGANYFITFTNDFIRYGFVYLMKHKHEVFETFKVFQNEVENQLDKKIKAIRSNRGGEYLSHEFVNHMKSCGIVSQLTLPYAPQHNEVTKRRNKTLHDMVRSMMNLTTLPKSFWGYALETAAHILNMVPTKKTDMVSNVHTFKARLVEKGYAQTYGVDYGETFSPVADIRAIRILLAIAAFYDYEIWQIDVNTAFLNGHISEDMYMVKPEGFVNLKHPKKVCKLQHSIYVLKQASRS